MPGKGTLSELQWRVLEALATVEPRWTLVGGGALVGFHTQHRTTRDLDLFFRGLSSLERLPAEITAILTATGFRVIPIQSGVTFWRLNVQGKHEQVVLDLVADPTSPAEEPTEHFLNAVSVLVDTPHAILVSKLTTLLSRVELRDLVDVKALVDSGLSLDVAVRAAPAVDGGFSPMMLAWALKSFPIVKLGPSVQMTATDVQVLEAYRDWLVQYLMALAKPV